MIFISSVNDSNEDTFFFGTLNASQQYNHGTPSWATSIEIFMHRYKYILAKRPHGNWPAKLERSKYSANQPIGPWVMQKAMLV